MSIFITSTNCLSNYVDSKWWANFLLKHWVCKNLKVSNEPFFFSLTYSFRNQACYKSIQQHQAGRKLHRKWHHLPSSDKQSVTKFPNLCLWTMNNPVVVISFLVSLSNYPYVLGLSWLQMQNKIIIWVPLHNLSLLLQPIVYES